MTAKLSARIPADPNEETLDVGSAGQRTVTVRELTVREVRAWLTEMAAQIQRDPLHALAFDEIGLDELARMTDWSADDLEMFAPSQLAEVLRVAKRINPDFFRIRGALIEAASRVTQTATIESSPDATEDVL